MHSSTRSIDDVNKFSVLEGWLLCDIVTDITEKIESNFRLVRDDDPTLFDGNEDIWKHVVTRAIEDTSLHRDALACLRDQGPVDFERILTTISRDQRIALAEIGISVDVGRIDAIVES